MNKRQRQDLDRYITGNYGEDQLRDETAARLSPLIVAVECVCCGHRQEIDPETVDPNDGPICPKCCGLMIVKSAEWESH